MSDISPAIGRFSGLANPTRFLALAARLIPWMTAVTVILFAVGLYL